MGVKSAAAETSAVIPTLAAQSLAGNAGIAATHTEAMSSGPTASAVLDYDNDGAPDLAVVRAKAKKVGLRRNQTRD